MAELPRIYFDRPLPDLYRDLLDGRAEPVGPEVSDLATADAVLAGAVVPWNAEAVREAPRVRVVSRIGIGYDNVDVAGLAGVGVVTCNTPDGPSVSTAEHALALLFAITKELAAHAVTARAGVTGGPALGLELDGRTLGLVGYGRIAKRVGAVGAALGMHVLAFDPFVDAASGASMVPLERVFRESDVISLHAPATPDTLRLVNAASLATMKRGVYLVNTARGPLVDHDALVAALDSGHVAGAGLDVTEPEPLPAGHPLLSHPRAIVTPHIASSTAVGRRRLYAMALDNALNVLAGRPASVVAP